MVKRWKYKNNTTPSPLQGINPIKDPVAYMNMINNPQNGFQLAIALLDENAPVTIKRNEFIRDAAEFDSAIILMQLLEYIETIHIENQNKEAMLHEWREQQVLAEQMRRQFDVPSEPGYFRTFDQSHNSSSTETVKLITQLHSLLVDLSITTEKINLLERYISDADKKALEINQAWLSTKAVDVKLEAQALSRAEYKLQVMVRDENGVAVKEADKQGNLKYVFRSVDPASPEGLRILDRFHVLPSETNNQALESKKKDEYALTRRLDALLLSYDVALPQHLEKTISQQMQPLAPQPKKTAITIDDIWKRERVDDAMNSLFVKTRGGDSVKELLEIKSNEMLAVLNAEKEVNKLHVKLQHKPSPATIANLTNGLVNAIVKRSYQTDLIMEKKALDQQVKEANLLVNEYMKRGLGDIDLNKVMKGTLLEKEDALQKIAESMESLQLRNNPMKG